MTPQTIPVFLNGRSATMPTGATLSQLVAQEAPELSGAFAAGQARATDARGIPADPEVVLSAGSIFRVFRSGRGSAEPADA